MEKTKLLKDGLDAINDGMKYLDLYLDLVKDTQDKDDLTIAGKIGKVCVHYKDLCDAIVGIYERKKKEQNNES